MSWVALEKPIRKRKNMMNWNQLEVPMVKATPAKAAPRSICIAITHHLFVLGIILYISRQTATYKR